MYIYIYIYIYISRLTDCDVTGLTCFENYHSYHLLYICLNWVSMKDQIILVF